MKIEIEEIVAPETYKLRHQVMWPDKPRAFVILANDEAGRHFGIRKGAEIISVVSLFRHNNSVQFRKFATKVAEQGNGYGTLLLKHVMTLAANEKLDKIWCNARVNKTSFYEKFGLVQTAKRFTKGGIDYVVMERKFEDGIGALASVTSVEIG